MKRQSKAFMNYLSLVSLRKKLNILNYNLRHTDEFSPHPLYAKIEINGTCNLDCVMCKRKSLPNRDKLMSVEQFETILKKIPSLVAWGPHGYNEPLMHTDFFEMVDISNNYGLIMDLVTNGTMMSRKNTDKLLDLRPHKVRFSIDGLNGTYEEIRKGAKWESVHKNLKYFASAVKQTETEFYLYATIWKDNIYQISKLIKLAEELDTNIVFADITWANEYGDSTYENSIRENAGELDLKEYLEPFMNNPRARFALGKPKKRSCNLPWASVYIDVVGDIYPCTDTFEHKMGNIFTDNFETVFNSWHYRGFRKRSIEGLNSECRACLSWAKMKK